MILFYVILHIDNPPPAAFTLKCILTEIWSFLLSLNSFMHLKKNKLLKYISFLLYQKPPVISSSFTSLRNVISILTRRHSCSIQHNQVNYPKNHNYDVQVLKPLADAIV